MTPVPTPSDADGGLGEEDGLRLLGACYEGSHAVFGVVTDLLARAREQAWDEGYAASDADIIHEIQYGVGDQPRTPNPHRIARDTQGGGDAGQGGGA